MSTLFTYGTLMISEVIETVIGRPAGPAEAATLLDYGCYRVRNKGFPAIIAEVGRQTTGCLYRNLDPQTLKRLDDYEGSLYCRCRVQVRLDDGRQAETWTYVLHPNAQEQLTQAPWQLEDFKRQHLRQFLLRCSEPRT